VGTINLKKIARIFETGEEESSAPVVRLFAFAIGSDANQTLLEELTEKCHGYFTRVRETEDVTAQLKVFFDKVGTSSIEGLKFDSEERANFYQVYSTGLQHSFDGSSYAFVGRYKKPEPQTTVSITGVYG